MRPRREGKGSTVDGLAGCMVAFAVGVMGMVLMFRIWEKTVGVALFEWKNAWWRWMVGTPIVLAGAAVIDLGILLMVRLIYSLAIGGRS